jgi:hypothetical protein
MGAAAARRGLPLVVHTREADDDTLAILAAARAVHPDPDRLGVLHCFTRDEAMARRALDLGLYISLSGIRHLPFGPRVARRGADDPGRPAADRDRRAVSLARACARPAERTGPSAAHPRSRLPPCAGHRCRPPRPDLLRERGSAAFTRPEGYAQIWIE